MSEIAQRKQAALAGLAAVGEGTINRQGYNDVQRGLLELTDADLAGVGTSVTVACEPFYLRTRQRLLLRLTDRESAKGNVQVGPEAIGHIAGCLNALPTRTEAEANWPGLRSADGRLYADVYEQLELPWIAVHSASIVANGKYSEDAEPIVRALAKVGGEHELAHSTKGHVGAIIDCWCQATGIEVENPTGVWEIITGAGKPIEKGGLGWKNPRTARS